jgi:branched-chain amino acid aminotransferase
MAEAFACGTAAVITPVGTVKSKDGTFTISGGQTGPVASLLREKLLDIQHGRASDVHGWMHPVPEQLATGLPTDSSGGPKSEPATRVG